LALKTINLDGKTFDVSYEVLNSSARGGDIVFLHGWGSNKEIMKQAFSPFLKKYRHIYLDMPGFGKSSNNYTLSTQCYAKIVKVFLTLLKGNIIAIVGHSYGGKVATLINPNNLILLSSAGILEKKSFKVKLKITIVKFLKGIGLSFLSKIFRSEDITNMDENMYKTFKTIVNEDFTKHFSSYEKNSIIFWGEKDKATPLSSGKKIHKLIKNSSFNSYNDGHYFFLKFAQDICFKIENGIK